MKITKTISVVGGDDGERIEITIKWKQKAFYNKSEIQGKFENLLDDVYRVLAKSYHVFAIKISKS